MRRNSHRVLVAILTGFACAFAPAVANAGQTCATAGDCSKGYVCQVVGGTACPGIACGPDTDACPVLPPCTPQEIRECVAGATCAVDTDCGANMVCHEVTSGSCPGSAPCMRSSNGAVDCPVPEPCTTTTTKECSFKWNLPCQTAADCGDATLFECAEVQVCSAGTSVGGGVVGGGTTETPPTSAIEPVPVPAPAPAPSTEPPEAGAVIDVPVVDAAIRMPYSTDGAPVCQPTGIKYCRALPKACTDNTQCPADWTCQIAGDIACPAIAYADGGSVPCTTQASTSGQCVPGSGWTYDSTLQRAVNSATETGGTTPPTSGSTTGAAGSASVPTPAPGAASGTTAAAPTADASGGGCSVSSGKNGAAGLLLALAALLALGRRRRI